MRGGCCIIDLGDFRIKSIEESPASPATPSGSTRRSRPSVGRTHSSWGVGAPSGELRILGSDGGSHWKTLLEDQRTMRSVANSLRTYTAVSASFRRGETPTDVRGTMQSGRGDRDLHDEGGLGEWGDILPADVQALTAIPILNHDRHPEVLVLLTSVEDHFRFVSRKYHTSRVVY